ncbi:7-carboxy-7-deazaguanine synthase [compost metagenome]
MSLETSGALDIAAVDPRVSRVVDLKTPGSGECARNLWSNIALLSSHDQLKFVICSRADYEWARQQLTERDLAEIAGLDIAHAYHSASEVARVGGDFYDIFELSNDRVGVTIGDVAGKGLDAATLRIVPDENQRKRNSERSATLRDFVRQEIWATLR